MKRAILFFQLAFFSVAGVSSAADLKCSISEVLLNQTISGIQAADPNEVYETNSQVVDVVLDRETGIARAETQARFDSRLVIQATLQSGASSAHGLSIAIQDSTATREALKGASTSLEPGMGMVFQRGTPGKMGFYRLAVDCSAKQPVILPRLNQQVGAGGSAKPMLRTRLFDDAR